MAVGLTNLDSPSNEGFNLNGEGKAEQFSSSPKGLAEVFGVDSIECASQTNAPVKEETAPFPETIEGFNDPTYWEKIKNWWKGTNHAETEAVVSTVENNPALDMTPAFPTYDYYPREVSEIIEQLSSETIDEVMHKMLLAQMSLEEYLANTTQTTYEHFEKRQEIHDQLLAEIREEIRKDTRIAGHLKTAEYVAMAATTVCTVASFFVALPVLASVAAGAFTALTSGAQGYYNYRSKQSKAKQETYKFHSNFCTEALDRSREDIQRLAESDSGFKDALSRFIKNTNQMKQAIIRA